MIDRHYTSIEQSRKLLELGLDPDSADMFYSYHYAYENHDESGWEGYEDYPIGEPYNNYTHSKDDWKKEQESMPCWSTDALLDLLPITIQPEGKEESCNVEIFKGLNKEYYIQYTGETPVEIYASFHGTLIDAVYSMVCWLVESGYGIGS